MHTDPLSEQVSRDSLPSAGNSIVPYKQEKGIGKREQVEQMFDHIAPTYNRLNRLMTGGLDLLWRKQVVQRAHKAAPEKILDAACGTGDLLLLMAQEIPSLRYILGADLSEQMLTIAEQRILDKRDTLSAKEIEVSFLHGDCTCLPLEAEQFDLITCAFGIRNFEDPLKGLREFARLLRPGGALIILELSTPERPLLRAGYHLYAHHLIPHMGRLLAHDLSAYRYLPQSIEAMPQRKDMICLITQAGLTQARFKSLTFGVATLYTATK